LVDPAVPWSAGGDDQSTGAVLPARLVNAEQPEPTPLELVGSILNILAHNAERLAERLDQKANSPSSR
jgi:hypothetical protein